MVRPLLRLSRDPRRVPAAAGAAVHLRDVCAGALVSAQRPIILPAEPPEKRAERLVRVGAFLGRLPADKPWLFTVEPWTKARSDRQNNALHGVAYATLSQFTGHTIPELHEMFLRARFGEVEREVMGVMMKFPRRTTTTDESGKRKVLSKAEMAEFYAFVQAKAAEIGCWIPDPDPMMRTRAA